MRQKYYVCMDYGLDETGKRVKEVQDLPHAGPGRRGLRDFQTEQDTHQTVAPRSMTLDQWLEYWMEEVIQPNRAATTIYGYRKIIDNHLSRRAGLRPHPKADAPASPAILTPCSCGTRACRPIRYGAPRICSPRPAHGAPAGHHSPLSHRAGEPPRVIPHEARFYTPAELKRLFGLVEGHWRS